MDIVAILTCDKPLYRARRASQEGWVCRLVRTGSFAVQTFTGATLGVPDGYLSLPRKTQALCTWAWLRGYSRLLKVDCDTWLDAAWFRLTRRNVVSDYAGCVRSAWDGGHLFRGAPADPPGTWPHPYAAGGGYWLSRRAMQIVAAAEIPAGTWCEDRWVGHVLAGAGIFPERIPEFNFYPGGMTLKMNVPSPSVIPLSIPDPKCKVR
jgi:hypothetical protein